jgi:hypothetical protein
MRTSHGTPPKFPLAYFTEAQPLDAKTFAHFEHAQRLRSSRNFETNIVDVVVIARTNQRMIAVVALTARDLRD